MLLELVALFARNFPEFSYADFVGVLQLLSPHDRDQLREALEDWQTDQLTPTTEKRLFSYVDSVKKISRAGSRSRSKFIAKLTHDRCEALGACILHDNADVQCCGDCRVCGESVPTVIEPPSPSIISTKGTESGTCKYCGETEPYTTYPCSFSGGMHYTIQG
jgi:hypothetical protein